MSSEKEDNTYDKVNLNNALVANGILLYNDLNGYLVKYDLISENEKNTYDTVSLNGSKYVND